MKSLGVGFVAIHGLGCHPMQGWPRVATALGQAIDAPLVFGADARAVPATEWPLRVQAQRFAAHVGSDDVLIGHSMGGAIAIRMAAESCPKALVLVEPHVVPSAGFVVKPTLEAGPEPDKPTRTAFLGRMAAIDTGEGTYADWIAKWHWPTFYALSRELAYGDGGRTSWLHDVARLDCPIHLVWGEKSPREDLHLDALKAIGIRPEWVQDSGHFIASEQPERLAKILSRFV